MEGSECKKADAADFWVLFDELCHDKSTFFYDRDRLLNHFKAEQMYTLTAGSPEAKDIFDVSPKHPIYPAFCCVDSTNTLTYIWIHTRYLHLPIAKKFVADLHIQNSAPESTKHLSTYLK